MVPCGGRFILKFWKAICFRFSGITSDVASENFQFGKLVSHHRPECSNIGKLFEWKMLSLWSCQRGELHFFSVVCLRFQPYDISYGKKAKKNGKENLVSETLKPSHDQSKKSREKYLYLMKTMKTNCAPVLQIVLWNFLDAIASPSTYACQWVSES